MRWGDVSVWYGGTGGERRSWMGRCECRWEMTDGEGKGGGRKKGKDDQQRGSWSRIQGKWGL
jgi:hypothetical protein